ncbi:unnamed protein product [Blepharisma stoltei]|uniref:Glutaredoxin domain-containing protein n=1 Tax=Blepharisma stoltei TaxID=1481888 RepID=A0AAU9ISS5_9CILI|nr:unnamed protein product [Blepharisma stoltei]
MGCQCSKYDKHAEARIDFIEPFTEVVKNQAKEYPVLVYSRSLCEQSMVTKSLLRKNSVNFEYFELDHMNDNSQIYDALQNMTSRKSTPYIFIGGTYFGGLRELQKNIDNGDFKERLRHVY